MARPSLRPRLRIVCGEEIVLGPGKADLLEAIRRSGALREAAADLGMSYMRAWNLIQTMNRSFTDPLVTTQRGGAGHGRAALTPTGRNVLNLYRRMEKASLRAAASDWRRLRRLLGPG